MASGEEIRRTSCEKRSSHLHGQYPLCKCVKGPTFGTSSGKNCAWHSGKTEKNKKERKKKMDRWLKISYTGELRYVDLPDSRSGFEFLDAVYRELDVKWIEFVYVSFFGEDLCLLIDECGKLKDGWEDRVNNCATLMYAPGVDCIVGDALLGRYQCLDDGDFYVVPCEPEYYKEFIRKMCDVFDDVHFVGVQCHARD
jgi:hypothetical protein